MSRLVRYLLSCVLLLPLTPALVGSFQQTDEPEEHPKQPDPFDAKNRRVQEGTAADLQFLRTAGIDPGEKSLLDYFRGRTLPENDRAKIVQMVEQLGSPDFRVREKASDDLVRRGPSVLEFLRKGVTTGDLETTRRAEQCIDRIRRASPSTEVTATAVRVLGQQKGPDVVKTLLAFLPYAETEGVVDEIRSVFQKRAASDATAAVELKAALADPVPLRRAAAGEALAALPAAAPTLRAMLRDADALVRLRVAQGLAGAGDKESVATLIDALPEVSAAQGWQAEDLLLRLSEGRSPPLVSRSGDEASKKAFRSAWQSWWAKNSAKVNLADLHKEAPLLGHTVIVLLDLGQILELNKKNEIVWKIQGVVFPLDVQTLPNGNVLVAEYHAGKVTERDKVRGEIKWEKSVNGPLVAQRLANRHTFVGTDSQVFEFDEKGNEVFAFGLPNGERFMKVAKLASGDIAALTSESRIVRLDAKGKELHSFNVPLSARLFGGRIHMLPNGRVIVPHNQENKVVEYDMDGNIVWEVSVPQPVAATRLPNGHTLVTTMQPQTGAIEFDRQGREVWTYRHTTRVTRAIRR